MIMLVGVRHWEVPRIIYVSESESESVTLSIALYECRWGECEMSGDEFSLVTFSDLLFLQKNPNGQWWQSQVLYRHRKVDLDRTVLRLRPATPRRSGPPRLVHQHDLAPARGRIHIFTPPTSGRFDTILWFGLMPHWSVLLPSGQKM